MGGLSYLFYGAAGVAVGAILMGNLSPLFIPKAQLVTSQYLAQAKLQTIDGKNTTFSAGDLWKKHGAVIMAVRRPG